MVFNAGGRSHPTEACRQPLFLASYLKATGGLALLAWQAARSPQEAEHLVHHVGVIDGLVAGPLHLLQELLLPPGLLLLLQLPLRVLAGQLGQALLGGGGDAEETASENKASLGIPRAPAIPQATVPLSPWASWPLGGTGLGLPRPGPRSHQPSERRQMPGQ